MVYKIFRKKLYRVNLNKIKKYQKYSAYALSFMHGAQDGQKFIGLVILYISIIKTSYNSSNLVTDNFWIIIFVSIIMFFGVSLRGQKNC